MIVYHFFINKYKIMNPFVYNSPVRGNDFFDREDAQKKILKETVKGKSQGNIWITGERQIGKTSLMRHLQSLNEFYKDKIIPYGSEKSLDVAFIFANVQGCTNEDDFYNIIWQGLKDFFDFKIKKTDTGYNNFINALKEVYTNKEYYVVLLIDEFDAFLETIAFKDPENATRFLAKLSSLLQEVDEVEDGSKAFGCVFAANHDMKELLNENFIDVRGSGLILESITLKWFTRPQVKELADLYLRGNRVQFSEKEIDICYGATHGYPYFTQKMLSLMYEARKEPLSGREYMKRVQSEFGQMFKETIEDWGGDKMPIRTLKKLIELVKTMDIGDKITKVLFATLEVYIKSRLV